MNEPLPRVAIPCIGERFPRMDVRTTMGPMALPDRFDGKWFILFSHPGDFTPVCTTEFASFALNHERFRRLNCELVGLSVDQVHSHIKWVEWIEEHLGVSIEYPIIADANGAVSRNLGAIHPPDAGTTVRAAYIVDPEAVLQSVMYYPPRGRQEHRGAAPHIAGAACRQAAQGGHAGQLAVERADRRGGPSASAR